MLTHVAVSECSNISSSVRINHNHFSNLLKFSVVCAELQLHVVLIQCKPEILTQSLIDGLRDGKVNDKHDLKLLLKSLAFIRKKQQQHRFCWSFIDITFCTNIFTDLQKTATNNKSFPK